MSGNAFGPGKMFIVWIKDNRRQKYDTKSYQYKLKLLM